MENRGKKRKHASVLGFVKVLMGISGAVACCEVSRNFWKTSVICWKLYLNIEVVSVYQLCLIQYTVTIHHILYFDSVGRLSSAAIRSMS